MKIQCLTTNGSRAHNEDMMFACENYGFVLDGATGLLDEHITKSESDAKWFAQTIAKYLSIYLTDAKMSLKKVLKQAIVDTQQEFKNFKGSETVKDYPSCCCTMYRIIKDKMQYLMLGDCALLYKPTNSKVVLVRPQDNIAIDKKNLQIVAQMAKEQHKTVMECRPLVQPYIIKGRMLKNTPQGYWIVSDEPKAVDHAIVGEVDLKDIEGFAIMSDGYTQIFDTFYYYTEDSFYKALQKIGVNKIYNKLYALQQKDSSCNRAPRFKLRDDATIVYVDVR